MAATRHIAVYGILVDANKAIFSAESVARLKDIAVLLTKNTSLILRIEGHTDNVGTPAANKALSGKRAQSVPAALKADGIDGARLSAVGWGSEKPVAGNADDEGRARNRRVELVTQ